jgi:hypothetical protein
LRYPALSSIAPLSADPVEWGPILLLRIRSVLLLWMLRMLRVVFRWYLRLVVLL